MRRTTARKAANTKGGMRSDFVFSSGSDWKEDEFDKMSFDSFSFDSEDNMPRQVAPPCLEDHNAYKEELDLFLAQIRFTAWGLQQKVARRRHALDMRNQEDLIAELSGRIHL